MDPESATPSLPPELQVLFFQGAADAMFVADPQGRLIAVNLRTCDLLGFAAGEMMGRPVLDFADPEDLQTNRSRTAELRAGKSVVSERQLRCKDGRLLPVELTTRMLPDGHLLGVARDITERKRAEQLLSHSHDLMRHVIEHSRSAIAVHDRDLKYIYVSQRYLDEYKVKEQDVIGKHHYDVFPDLPQKWRDVHQRALAGEVSSAEDDPYVRDDGTVDWTRWECRPWYEADGAIGGIIVYTEVITERKRAEEAARAAEMLLRATMEAVADGILAVDARGAVVFTNARFADLWRIPHEIADSRDDAQLLGFVLDQLEDPAAFLAKVQALYHSAEGSVDTLCFKDGRVFERWSRPLLMNDGAIAGRVWCFRDVTERKRAEESRLEMERRMLHAQRLESLGVLAGGIAHDFNNLLMAILGNLELAQRDLSPVSPIRPRLDAASNAARRAADLTRQMLAYSGRGKFMVGRVDLNELVEENVHLLRTSIPRTTTLNLHLDRALPAVEADAGQIQQVVMNLITNASEAIGEVPGVITLSTGVRDCDGSYLGRSRLEEVPPAGCYPYFEVTDTGCGMDEETQKRMFEPFFTTKFTGRGLGLPAVFGIVRGHGGAILLDSAAGKGTAIRVLFPAAEVAPGAAGPAEAAPAGEAEVAPGRGRGTILIVDDEEMVLQPCAAMVESMGFAVLTAVDGEQAVEIVRRHGASIRAIILDLTMPKLDGAAAFEQILRIEPGAKVILSSGYDEAEATGRLAKEQLAGFIRKPYYLEQLRATLERVLGTAL